MLFHLYFLTKPVFPYLFAFSQELASLEKNGPPHDPKIRYVIPFIFSSNNRYQSGCIRSLIFAWRILPNRIIAPAFPDTRSLWAL